MTTVGAGTVLSCFNKSLFKSCDKCLLFASKTQSMPLKYFNFPGDAPLWVMVHSKACPGGGIGRRARFRSVYRKMWRFEFSPGHQDVSGDCCHHKKPLKFSGFFVAK